MLYLLPLLPTEALAKVGFSFPAQVRMKSRATSHYLCYIIAEGEAAAWNGRQE